MSGLLFMFKKKSTTRRNFETMSLMKLLNKLENVNPTIVDFF